MSEAERKGNRICPTVLEGMGVVQQGHLALAPKTFGEFRQKVRRDKVGGCIVCYLENF